MDSPVIFPPGRARLATNPVATGSTTATMTMGEGLGCLLGCLGSGRCHRKDGLHPQTDQFSRKVGEPIILPLRKSGLNDDVLALHVAELAQPLPETLESILGRRVSTEARV